MGTTMFARGALLAAQGIICIVTSMPVWAESPQLTLPQAVEYSLRNNGELQSFREEKGISDAGKVRAGLLPNPTLDFEADTGALTGSNAENSLSVGISQEFPLSGKRGKRLAIAEFEQEIYRWQLADRERMVRHEVKTAFHDVILAKKRIELADRAIALNRQLLDVAMERLTAGDIPELEMNIVKVELARSEGSRIDIAKALIQSRTRLWAVMGLSGGEPPEIVGNLDAEAAMTKPPVDAIDLARLKRLASEKRPDLMALEAEKKRGEADIVLARAEGVPNLSAGVAVTRDRTFMEIGGLEGNDTAYTIGLKLSMPIPVFDKNQAGVQEASARRNSIESRLMAARRNVELEVESACASFLNSETVLSLYKTNIIPQLEENLKLTQEAYRLGEVGLLAVIQEQKKFIEVSEGYLAALHDMQAALVKLESAVATELAGGAQ